MKIDQRLIREKACVDAVHWYLDQDTDDAETLLSNCDNLSWIAWYLEHTNLVTTHLALKLVKLVLPLFESKFPEDDRPRKAIKAFYTAHDAHDAADAAAADAAAADAARDAHDAARDAYNAAYNAAYAANARDARDAAYDAAYNTYNAAYAANATVYIARSTCAYSYDSYCYAIVYASNAASIDKTYIEKFKQIVREEVINYVKDD